MQYKNTKANKRKERMSKTKRVREECGCGCLRTTVWECYNAKLETLKQASKKLKIRDETKEYARDLGAEIKRDEDSSWVVEHEDPENLVASLRVVLKSKEVSKETHTALEMLEGCELEEVPIRAAYMLEHLFQ